MPALPVPPTVRPSAVSDVAPYIHDVPGSREVVPAVVAVGGYFGAFGPEGSVLGGPFASRHGALECLVAAGYRVAPPAPVDMVVRTTAQGTVGRPALPGRRFVPLTEYDLRALDVLGHRFVHLPAPRYFAPSATAPDTWEYLPLSGDVAISRDPHGNWGGFLPSATTTRGSWCVRISKDFSEVVAALALYDLHPAP